MGKVASPAQTSGGGKEGREGGGILKCRDSWQRPQKSSYASWFLTLALSYHPEILSIFSDFQFCQRNIAGQDVALEIIALLELSLKYVDWTKCHSKFWIINSQHCYMNYFYNIPVVFSI